MPDATLLHTAHKLKCARGNVTYPQFLLLLSRLHLTAERERIASRRVRALSNNAGGALRRLLVMRVSLLLISMAPKVVSLPAFNPFRLPPPLLPIVLLIDCYAAGSSDATHGDDQR